MYVNTLPFSSCLCKIIICVKLFLMSESEVEIGHMWNDIFIGFFFTISRANLFTHDMYAYHIHINTLTSICEMSTIISNTNQPGVAMAMIQNARASAKNTRTKICPAFFVIVAVLARKKNNFFFFYIISTLEDFIRTLSISVILSK